LAYYCDYPLCSCVFDNLMSKGDELPILQEPEEPINDGYDNQAVLQGWLEGKDFVKTS
jgi:hypothetical protein